MRLAILDLSPAGHQPMTLPGGRFTIAFNGEITNYVEIRDELVRRGQSFTSTSDTEVLLKAWAHWGVGALDRLEGMFAFAILDTAERTLTLVRDPYGIKPLFYSADSHRFAFCSELVGLMEMTDRRPRLDWQVAVDYIQWSVVDHTDHTFIEGVRQLAPGHLLSLDLDSGRVSEPAAYWHPDVAATFTGSYDEATERVRDLFLDSVRRNLRSDVPVGIALSGGVDSSAIAGAVRHLEPDLPIDTFSFIAPGYVDSEHDWVDLVANALGARSHTTVASADDLERDLDDLIRAAGEPFGSTSIYAQYRVFACARDHGITVTLDGQGGDELFAGYFGYPAPRLKSLIETGHWVSAVRFAREWGRWPGRSPNELALQTVGQFVPTRWRGRILRRPPSPILDASLLREHGVDTRFPLASGESVRGRRLVSQLRSALMRTGLPSLLRNGDRNSMHFSIESRVPFLDRALTEFVLSLPEEWLVGPDGTTKRILRDAVRDLLPAQVVDRRDKIGFATPESDLLGRLATQAVDADHPIAFLRGADPNLIAGGLSESELGLGAGSHWRLINLRRWVSLYDVDASA